MKLYVAGPMSGLPDWNYPAFAEAAKALRVAGYMVENPGEGYEGTEGTVDGWTWEDYLRRALRQMLTCEAVALLDGWESSKGARLEVATAEALSMPVRSVEEWLAEEY